MTKHNSPEKQNKHVIGGIVVLTIGLLALLRNFHILSPEMSHFLFSWKTLLIGIGILNLIFAQNKVAGFILIAIGTFFWLPQWFDMSIRAGQVFWPIVIIFIGIMLLFKKPYHKQPPRPWNRHSKPQPESARYQEHTQSENTEGATENRGPSSSDDYINDMTLFSSSSKIITSKNFKGGNLTAIFGGSELNLSHARLAPGRNILNVTFIFGGTEIVVPSDWTIIIEATPVFGGFTDKRYISSNMQTEENTDTVLIIKGLVLFGGAEIKSY